MVSIINSSVGAFIIVLILFVVLVVTVKKGNRWNLITIRMGKINSSNFHSLFKIFLLFLSLTIYTRSPAAYKAFSSFGLFQLPSTNTLKVHVQSNAEAAGEVEKHLLSERSKYNARVQNRSCGLSNPPLCQGPFISDEVKVAAKLHWNSCNDQKFGHTMTAKEMTSLHDIYTLLDEELAVKS